MDNLIDDRTVNWWCRNDSWANLQVSAEFNWQLINQSINIKSARRRYTTRPGAPTVVSDKHDQKVHSWVVFWKY